MGWEICVVGKNIVGVAWILLLFLFFSFVVRSTTARKKSSYIGIKFYEEKQTKPHSLLYIYVCVSVFMFCNDSLPTVWYIGQVNFLVYGQHQYCIVSTNTLQTPGYDSIVYSLIITGQIDIYIFAQLPFLAPICHLHLNSNCKFSFTHLPLFIPSHQLFYIYNIVQL